MAEVEDQVLDLLAESSAGLTIRQLLRAVPATINQLTGALVNLQESGRVSMDVNGRYTPIFLRCYPKTRKGSSGYLDQRTRKGGVLTAEGFIPYVRHPSGWDLPVKIDGRGYPIRRNRRLVFALPDGGEYQPEDAQSLDRKIRGVG